MIMLRDRFEIRLVVLIMDFSRISSDGGYTCCMIREHV